MRVDVVERRCKVVQSEVNTLTTILNTIIHSINNIKGIGLPYMAWEVGCPYKAKIFLHLPKNV